MDQKIGFISTKCSSTESNEYLTSTHDCIRTKNTPLSITVEFLKYFSTFHTLELSNTECMNGILRITARSNPFSFIFVPDDEFLGCTYFYMKITNIFTGHLNLVKANIMVVTGPTLVQTLLNIPSNYIRVQLIKPNMTSKERKYKRFVPSIDPFVTYEFSTCAIVGNRESLLRKGMGGTIDSHDAVFRFNGAPVLRHSSDEVILFYPNIHTIQRQYDSAIY